MPKKQWLPVECPDCQCSECLGRGRVLEWLETPGESTGPTST